MSISDRDPFLPISSLNHKVRGWIRRHEFRGLGGFSRLRERKSEEIGGIQVFDGVAVGGSALCPFLSFCFKLCLVALLPSRAFEP